MYDGRPGGHVDKLDKVVDERCYLYLGRALSIYPGRAHRMDHQYVAFEVGILLIWSVASAFKLELA